MATATGRALCFMCDRERNMYKCSGCSKDFCFDDLAKHRQILATELVEIENDRKLSQEKLIQQKQHSKIDFSVEQINKWENDSINKIKQTAEECRQILFQHTNTSINQIEDQLIKLTDEIKKIRKEDEVNEFDLNQLKTKLTKLTEELDKSPKISMQQDSTSFINKISVILSSGQILSFPQIGLNTKWKPNAITIAGGNGKGVELNQLNFPEAIYVDDDQTIYIADRFNHRIIEWRCNETNGRVVAGGNGEGDRNNQLNHPTDVFIDKKNDSIIISDWKNRRVMRWSRQNDTNGQIIISDIGCWGLTIDNNGYLYIADAEKHEVRRWRMEDSQGAIVAGGNGQGGHLNQLSSPSYIFVDEDYSVYVSDGDNNRVVKWMKDAKEGIVVAGGNGKGNSLTQLSSLRGVTVDHSDQVYVVDRDNHQVMRWCKGALYGTIVAGGSGRGAQSNQLKHPIDLSFDRQGNLYVVDRNNHRIQKFEIDLNYNSSSN